MYEEVEINSQEELALYLINEGDLYADHTKVHLKFDREPKKVNPFRVTCSAGGGAIMNGYWDADKTTYYKKVEWFESIPEGKRVPCYVSDINPNRKTILDAILSYDKGRKAPYIGSRSGWRYATPIPADELWIP